MTSDKRALPIRTIISLVFLAVMLISICSIGALIFTSWYKSADETTRTFARHISDDLYEQIQDFVHVPMHINEVNNHVISSALLDLTEDSPRDTFFVKVMEAHEDDVYSFSYGTSDGKYYGARRNETGQLEIMQNDARTGGHSWYYAVNPDLTAGDLVADAGAFDPRTRAWYQAAAISGQPTFSPAYKHFVIDDLAISAGWPVFAPDGSLQGVLGAHMLLSGIGSRLSEAVQAYDGFALIVENETGALVANSMGRANFTSQPDGTLERALIGDFESQAVHQAYQEYLKDQQAFFLYRGGASDLYVAVHEIRMPGIEWIVFSAIPRSYLLAPVMANLTWTILLVILGLILAMGLNIYVTRRLLNPMQTLLQVSSALTDGDLSQRVAILRNDEIGVISSSFNQVADKMQRLINNLEETVRDRTADLEASNSQLQLILDSTAEAIYGIDLAGNCTFCNRSSIALLGYGDAQDLLGKNMHQLLHHTTRDGKPFPLQDCKVYQAIQHGHGYAADDEVFWKADQSAFDVAYHAYPQIKNGKVVGGVITFMDITEHREHEDKIRYLNEHDALTGLFNRRVLEHRLNEMDKPENWPLSVIFADINGLKLTNDIFGHAAGDELIQKSAQILAQSCREKDVVARIGGDEFVILLPSTSKANAHKLLERIREGFAGARVAAVKCSISLGVETKTDSDLSLAEILANAENAMYKDKTVNRHAVQKDAIDTIVETLHGRSERERFHSRSVSELCARLGRALNLNETQIKTLERAGYLHDIGKIAFDDKTVAGERLDEDEMEAMQQHAIVGYRILNLFDETLDLSEYVYSHHERWDGKGYPRGLKGEQIPLLSRIVAITETYDRVLHRGDLPLEQRREQALGVIRNAAGTQFDPNIAAEFLSMMAEG